MQSLVLVNTWTAKGCSETGLPMHSTDQGFWSEQFRKYLSCEAQVSFQNVQNFM